ncbi:cytochrome P450 [Leptolyngbya sp. FACHB-541]|uniref:cytochrome P450 n=1 Tax=Leptolyngbya sp. FACHB-541 TaxID=2692810 RepID=UPI001686B8A8|nr:cytochrome P450 [Leptolyngbya sp. FACHB-541]MBD2000880.1 cytochrome P450 [Leptolyngbya sp. FACHB-541]
MSLNLQTLPHPNVQTAIADYSRDRLEFMTRCAQEFEDIVPFQFGDAWYCLLTNPNHIAEVLKDRLLFVKAKDLQMLHGLLGNGLLTSEGDFWLRQRRLAQPVFHQHRINSYGAIMVDYTQKMLQTWQEGQIQDVHEAMMRLTLNIVMKTLFDLDVADGEANRIAHALDEAMNWAEHQEQQEAALASGNIGAWFQQSLSAIAQILPRSLQSRGTGNEVDRRYQKAIAMMDETIYAMIQHRRTNGTDNQDLLGMLMQIEDADDGSRMTDKQLRDEVATLILAGHETTANTLSWTWMLLANHPHIRQKLDTELSTVLDGRSPTITDLPQLTYTHWVVKESMRLYPPVTEVTREATQDCEIGGYAISKGSTLIASQWVMHRHPHYFAEPEVFNPERWNHDLEKQLPRGVYFPFGDGPRVCIGKSFAVMEAILILATIAQTFHLELAPDQTIKLQPSITLRPKDGIQVVLKKV